MLWVDSQVVAWTVLEGGVVVKVSVWVLGEVGVVEFLLSVGPVEKRYDLTSHCWKCLEVRLNSNVEHWELETQSPSSTKPGLDFWLKRSNEVTFEHNSNERDSNHFNHSAAGLHHVKLEQFQGWALC